MSKTIELDGHSLTRAQLVDVARGAGVALDAGALQRVARAADFLAAQAARQEVACQVAGGERLALTALLNCRDQCFHDLGSCFLLASASHFLTMNA